MALDGTPHVTSAYAGPGPFDGRALTPATRMRWRAVLIARVVIVGLLLAMAFDGSRLGDNADLLANALMFSVGPWHVLLMFLTARDEALPWYVSFADAAILAATSTLVAPGLWAPILLAAPTIVAVESAVAGRAWGLASAGWTTAAFLIAGAAIDVAYLPALGIALGLACLTTAAVVGQIAHEHMHTRTEQEQMLDQVL